MESRKKPEVDLRTAVDRDWQYAGPCRIRPGTSGGQG